MTKRAATEHPIQELLATRWSPYAFDSRPVSKAVTALAIGYVGDPDRLPPKLKERDLAPRMRKPLKEFIFSGQWGRASGRVLEK